MSERRRPTHALARIAGTPWAMRAEALDALARSAQAMDAAGRELRRPSRSRAAHDSSALRVADGEALDGARRVRVVDGIAYRAIRGPLFHDDELLAWWFDGDTYEAIARDLRAALDASHVQAIVLAFSSPGGHVAGCDELAQRIRAAADEKPIIANAVAEACSAAYWLASACTEFVAAPTALAGCLGTQLVYLDDTAFLEQLGFREIRIVSSQTPRKNSPPTEDAGRNDLQRVVDDQAAVMLGRIGEYRGVDPDVAAEQFGAGAVFVGERAHAAGMVDRLTTSEALHAELVTRLAEERRQAFSGALLTTGARGFTSARGTAVSPASPTGEISMSTRTTPRPGAPAAEAAQPAATESTPPTAAAASAAGTAEPTTPPAGTAASGAGEPEHLEIIAVQVADGAEAVAALRRAYPQAVAAIETDARTAGATAERERILGIEALALPGHDELVAAAKKDGAVSPDAFARQLLEAERGARTGALTALAGDENRLTPPAPLAAGATAGAAGTAEADQVAAQIINAGRRPATAGTAAAN